MADEIGYPVALKPLDGSMGRGVYAGITNPDDLSARYSDLMDSVAPDSAVLEKHLPGDDFRILVYGSSVAGVCQRIPANIVGDGEQTVTQLINEKNIVRSHNPFLSKGTIRPDNEIEYFLSRANLSFDSIPQNGHHIRLRSAANASAGGDVVDVTNDFPAHIKRAAVAAVEAVPGLFCAGVDVLYSPTSATGESTYSVLELNAHPQIGVNMYPTIGVGQDVPRKIIDTCFPRSKRRNDHADENVSLPRLRTLMLPMKAGVANSITLPPLPARRFPSRAIYSITTSAPLKERQYDYLMNLAQKHKVSGFARQEHPDLQILAAGTHQQVKKFIEAATRAVGTNGAPASHHGNWRGAISLGFHIDSSRGRNSNAVT